MTISGFGNVLCDRLVTEITLRRTRTISVCRGIRRYLHFRYTALARDIAFHLCLSDKVVRSTYIGAKVKRHYFSTCLIDDDATATSRSGWPRGHDQLSSEELGELKGRDRLPAAALPFSAGCFMAMSLLPFRALTPTSMTLNITSPAAENVISNKEATTSKVGSMVRAWEGS